MSEVLLLNQLAVKNNLLAYFVCFYHTTTFTNECWTTWYWCIAIPSVRLKLLL